MNTNSIRLDLAVNQHVNLGVDEDVHVDVKRLDLIHPEINGNKWFKLKYNLEQVVFSEHKTLLTFGGAFSNHIFATASAGKEFGIKTIGIIRGEEPSTWSKTLLHARACGMQLEFIERLAYEEKETEDFTGWLHEVHGAFHRVPEGGSNFLGVNGCMEILSDFDKNNYDVICCSCGTGATAAGLLLSANTNQRVMGFSALKGGDFLFDEVIRHISYFLMNDSLADEFRSKLEIISDYHFGGYAKWNDELIDFIRKVEMEFGIPLDQVYTGKMMFGLAGMMRIGVFEKGCRILVIHSGGLQGRVSQLLV